MYRISFQQINYFLTVAEVLNFTDAAKIMYISQPALSKQINILERELGFQLFIRDKRHVSLTPEGVSLFRDWRALNDIFESSIYNAKIIGNKTSGELDIGCMDTFNTEDVLSKLLKEFSSLYPKVDINIESHSFKTLRENLLDETMDLIITPYFELENLPDVDWVKIKNIQLGIVVPILNPLSQRDYINIEDLQNETFVLISPHESPGGTERTTSLCRKYGFTPKDVKYVPNATSLALAIRNRLGIAICDIDLVSDRLDSYKIYQPDSLPSDLFLVAVWKKHRKSIALDLFKNIIFSTYGSLEV